MKVIDQTLQRDQVLNEVNRMYSLFPDAPLNIKYQYGLYLKSTIQQYKDAIKIFEEIEENHSGWSNYQIGLCYNLLGNKDKCLEYLEESFAKDRNCQEGARFYKELDNLREDNKFKMILTYYDGETI